MGGVDLWQSEEEHGDGFAPQSHQDQKLEVVGIYGAWHLGKLQVGLSRALRLAQGRHVKLMTRDSFPVQVDGEPWVHELGTIEVQHHGQAFMLKRSAGEPMSRAAGLMSEILERAETKGTITAAQRSLLLQEVALRFC
eukprot:TRINITY_DN115_c0_g1_i2.p2 TRINITY_DN115_c0_g1~~TRINITY_DN115_c0_g1_i2.p2  ORF type:complete len:138 (-),score=32.33 TRINITY_DN115_c0_g1_i2:2000-2413(-)